MYENGIQKRNELSVCVECQLSHYAASNNLRIELEREITHGKTHVSSPRSTNSGTVDEERDLCKSQTEVVNKPNTEGIHVSLFCF